MSYALKLQAAQARAKAALIDLLLVASDGGINGDFDSASVAVEVDEHGDVHGQFVVGRVLPSGDVMPSLSGAL